MPNHISAIVDRYLTTWNETDAKLRAERVARTFSPAARYVDPLAASEGHASIAQLIGAVQHQFPNHVFMPRAVADAHSTFVRFSWTLGPAGGDAIAGGTDFATLDSDERLAGVTGFLDAITPAARSTRFVDARDGARLWVADTGGEGVPIVFAGSWAMTSAMWHYQVATLAGAGLRCITYDRRGHGNSSGTVDELDLLADDLASVLDALHVTGAVLVGHSIGCAEIVRSVARHGSARVAKIVLIAPASRTPRAAEMSAALWAEWRRDFPAWIAANTSAFFTPDTPAALVAWLVADISRVPVAVAIATDRAIATADLTADLRAVDRPTLVLHGDHDASAPLDIGQRIAHDIRGARLSIVEGAPHGLFVTHAARVNAELHGFATR